MPEFVVDAGPFIHLEQIGHLKLLEKLPSLLVPESILLEITRGPSNRSLKAVEHWKNVKRAPVSRLSRGKEVPGFRKATLQPGEIDCIHLALENRPCVFLTDDLAARTASENLSIEVHGTVGIIAYAAKERWLSLEKAQEALTLLYERSSLFITPAIIENAIQSLRRRI